MTSQDCIKVEHVRTWLFRSSLAKFLQFESECFFQVCFNLFLPAYMVHVQFLPWSLVFLLFFSPCEDRNFGFFWSEIFKRLFDETHVFGRSFNFCYFCLLLWGIDFAPARGSPASVSDHVMTSQDYIKVEKVRTWLLSSSLAKFQQFESECFFQVCFNLFLQCFFSETPALKLGQQFTGTAAETPLTLLFSRLNTAIFPVKRR